MAFIRDQPALHVAAAKLISVVEYPVGSAPKVAA
jgi:hypothetical protein